MSEGRPMMFVQDETPSEHEDGEESSAATAQASPPTAERKIDPIGNKLKFGDSYKEKPMFEGQARAYPDSVKVVDERYIFLDVQSKQDMDRYAEIRMSDSKHDRYKITSEERMQWSDQKQTWFITFRYQERMFKTFITNEGPPSDP